MLSSLSVLLIEDQRYFLRTLHFVVPSRIDKIEGRMYFWGRVIFSSLNVLIKISRAGCVLWRRDMLSSINVLSRRWGSDVFLRVRPVIALQCIDENTMGGGIF